MRLLYINKIETNANWGLETFLNQEFRRLGIETICVDYEKNKYHLATGLSEIDQDFDAFLLQRGGGYLPPLQVIKAIQRPRFFLFTELVARNPKQHCLLTSNLFEKIFLRSLPCVERVTQHGWLSGTQVDLVLSAIDLNFHKPFSEKEKDIDVLFIGTLLPRRQQIIEQLSQKFQLVFKQAFGAEMGELISRAKIVLNIHGETFLDTETRVYEVLAYGGFLITEQLSSENPFQSGMHLVEVSTVSEMESKIAHYLDHPEERRTIAEAGYQEVIHNHTFLQRARQILQAIAPHISQRAATTPPLNREALQRCILLERWLEKQDQLQFQTRRTLSRIKQRLLNR